MANDERFIDAESQFGFEKNTYEELLIKQLHKTAEAFSDILGEAVRKEIKVDTREIAINCCRTLHALMNPYIKDDEERDRVKQILKDIDNYFKEKGETPVIVRGKGQVKAKDMIHKESSVVWQRAKDYEVEKYRELFNLLVEAYHKYKQDIKMASIE